MSRNRLAPATEWTVALVLSLVILFLHVVVMRHAGGLWRDEVNTVEVAAAAPGQLWSDLGFESFPVLWVLVLRVAMAAGIQTDAALRVLGLLVGLGVLAAFWWSARRLSGTVPLVSLLLFGLSPVGLRYGDSVRAYGLGIILVLVASGLMWRVARGPAPRAVALALAAAVASVQCLYQNAFLLAGLCAGAIAVAARHRRWRHALLPVGIGAVAAVSLLPYRELYRKAQLAIDTSYFPVSVGHIAQTVTATLATPSPLMLWLWLGFLAVGGGLAAWRIRHLAPAAGDDREDLACFALTAMLVAIPLQGIFLKLSGFSINPWHYVVLLAFTAACLDAILAVTLRHPSARLALALLVLLAGAFLTPDIGRHLRVRHTSVDLIAAQLSRVAAAGDLIVVGQWGTGITFRHYYHGAAVWTTLPPMDNVRVHRHDLLKQAMYEADPIRPVLVRLADTLRADRRVWLVLERPILDRRGEPPPPPRVPHPVWRWNSGLHIQIWAQQVWYYVLTRATDIQQIGVPTEDPVSPFEDMVLVRAAGFR